MRIAVAGGIISIFTEATASCALNTLPFQGFFAFNGKSRSFSRVLPNDLLIYDHESISELFEFGYQSISPS